MSPCRALLLSLSTLIHAQDIILRNGTIIDGSGAKPYRADIAISNGYIHRIGNLKTRHAPIDLDVTGLIIAPGFINLHSHASPSGVRHARNMITQGVTTEIVNADGGGSIEITSALANFAANGLAVNLGAYIGFNSVWATINGRADHRPTTQEIQQMRDILTANLKQGAWGVSAGLDYKPAYFARTEEAIAVMKAATPWRTNFPNHDRLTPENKYSSLAGHAETIEIAQKSKVLPVITHMKVQGYEQGSAAKAILALKRANAVADLYPYLAGQTGLGSLFVPAWAVEGTREEMLARFHDPALRPRIIREIEDAIKARILTADNIDIPSKGRKFSSFMEEYGAGPGETMLRILETEQPSAILKFGAESDLVELMRYAGAAISCDCGASEEYPGMHPRYFGTFPRVLGHYVRDTKTITLEDAVRKMTGLPASIIGLVDRGLLAPGMAADITVFDPVTIIDLATYKNPTEVSEGVRHVIVNGKLALRDGKPTGEQGGQILKRSENMPSRPLQENQIRSVHASGRGFQLNLSQGPTDHHGRGTFQFQDLRLTDFGILQTAGQWASFTALAGDKPALVIIDGANPLASEPVIRIQIQGSAALEAKPDKLTMK